jgi:uncharacterized membrane protein YjjB (DUF3815 family)
MLISAIGAFGGTLGFCYLLAAPRRTILPASVTGLVGFVIYVVLFRHMGQHIMLSHFAATVVVTVMCEMLARVMRLPSTVFLLTSLVPLVPGYSFYSAMLALVQDDGALAASQGMAAVQIVAAIAVGAAVTSVCFRTLATRRRRMQA